MWQFVFNTDSGLLNTMLGWLGIGPVPWLLDPGLGDGLALHGQRLEERALRHRGLLAAMQGVPRHPVRRREGRRRLGSCGNSSRSPCR